MSNVVNLKTFLVKSQPKDKHVTYYAYRLILIQEYIHIIDLNIAVSGCPRVLKSIKS